MRSWPLSRPSGGRVVAKEVQRTPMGIPVHLGKRVLAPSRLGDGAQELREAVVEKIGSRGILVRFDDGKRCTRAPAELEEIPSPSVSAPLERAVAVRDALVAALPPEWEAEALENSPEGLVVRPPGEAGLWQIWAEATI